MALLHNRWVTRLTNAAIGSPHRRLWQALLLAYTVAFYSLAFGFRIGIVLTAILAAHEIGHLIMAKAWGIKNYGTYFIAPLGAFVIIETPDKRLDEAVVSLGGPLSGLLLAVTLELLSLATQNPVLGVIGHFVAITNLINLFPSASCDGGAIVRAVMRSLSPNDTAKAAAFTAAIVLNGVAAVMFLAADIWLPSVTLVIFAVFLLLAARRHIRDQRRLESLAGTLNVQPLRHEIETRLALELAHESQRGGKSLDEDQSLHELFGLQPHETQTLTAALRSLRRVIGLNQFDDMLPMSRRSAGLVLAGYVVTVTGLTQLTLLTLLTPQFATVFRDSIGGLLKLLIH